MEDRWKTLEKRKYWCNHDNQYPSFLLLFNGDEIPIKYIEIGKTFRWIYSLQLNTLQKSMQMYILLLSLLRAFTLCIVSLSSKGGIWKVFPPSWDSIRYWTYLARCFLSRKLLFTLKCLHSFSCLVDDLLVYILLLSVLSANLTLERISLASSSFKNFTAKLI